MQNYANRMWNGEFKTKFSGFKDASFRTTDILNICEWGYITETSPMGTKTCLGRILYSRLNGNLNWQHKDMQYLQNGFDSSNCRWK